MRHDLDTAALEEAVEREIRDGLNAAQIAVARDGEVVWTRSFGSASPTTRFWIASATKPLYNTAIVSLIGDGLLDIARPVASYLPDFGANGKQAVTVEQVLLMTCGFPNAAMSPADGMDPARRRARLAEWTLESEPGTHYAYHASSAHWVLAELIECVGGLPHCEFFEQRITRPLGLPRLLGLTREAQTDIAQLSPAATQAVRAAYDYAAKIEAGEPGGGIAATAANVAAFYQAILHDPAGLWDSRVLADAVGKVRCRLPDPQMQLPANRTLLGVVGAGFGATWGASPSAWGWPGVGGQIAFVEPRSGVSFAFLQMGDPDPTSQFTRGARLSQLALELGAQQTPITRQNA